MPSNQPKTIAHNTIIHHHKLHVFQTLKAGTREGDRVKKAVQRTYRTGRLHIE